MRWSAAQRRRAALVVRLLIEFLRDAVAVALDSQPRLSEPDDLRRLRTLTERVDAEQLLDMIERCMEAEMQIERYVQLVLVLEALVDALGGCKCGGQQFVPLDNSPQRTQRKNKESGF